MGRTMPRRSTSSRNRWMRTLRSRRRRSLNGNVPHARAWILLAFSRVGNVWARGPAQWPATAAVETKRTGGSGAVYLPPGLSVPKTSHWQKVGKQTMTTFRKFNLEEKNSDKCPQNNQDYRLLNLHSLTADLLLPRPTIFFTWLR